MDDWFSSLRAPTFEDVKKYLPTVALGALFLVPITYCLYRYESSIRRSLRKVQESDLFGQPKDPFRMIRVSTQQQQQQPQDSETNIVDSLMTPPPGSSSSSSNSGGGNNSNRLMTTLVEILPEYKRNNKNNKNDSSRYHHHHRLDSLGSYLTSLRPAIGPEKLPDWMENEVQAAMGAAVLRAVGPKFGAALLPGLGVVTNSSMLQSSISSMEQALSRAFATTTTTDNNNEQQPQHGMLQGAPVSIFAISYLAEVNYNVTSRNRNKSNSDSDSSNSSPTPLDRLSLGEVGFEPSFSNASHSTSKEKDESGIEEQHLLIPNPFHLLRDWDKALSGMEDLLQQESLSDSKNEEAMDETKDSQQHQQQQQRMDSVESTRNVYTAESNTAYNPHSRQMPDPVAIDERLLPDLYMGWGRDVLCTHTQRQVLQNRLLSCLLNRLAYNYYVKSSTSDNEQQQQQQQEVFRIVLDHDKDNNADKQVIITKPPELLEALMDMGHSIEACITTHITSFGIALCVKETHNSWTNLPLAYMLQTGYTSSSSSGGGGGSDSSTLEAVCALPHSGLNLEVYNGPLLTSLSSSSSPGRMSIQHFMGVESFCGWQSNHNADVSWIRDIDCGKRLRYSPPSSSSSSSSSTSVQAVENDKNRQDILTAVTLAALQAVTVNGVGTEYNLPLGGYGLTGVCNDSAAWLEQAMFGTTQIYPITMNGRFARLLLSRAVVLRKSIMEMNNKEHSARDDNSGGCGGELKHDLVAVDKLIRGLQEIESDMNSLPSQALDQCRRQLHCIHPETPFSLLRQSKQILDSIEDELKGIASIRQEMTLGPLS